jgi:hypothetical protein
MREGLDGLVDAEGMPEHAFIHQLFLPLHLLLVLGILPVDGRRSDYVVEGCKGIHLNRIEAIVCFLFFYRTVQGELILNCLHRPVYRIIALLAALLEGNDSLSHLFLVSNCLLGVIALDVLGSCNCVVNLEFKRNRRIRFLDYFYG